MKRVLLLSLVAALLMTAGCDDESPNTSGDVLEDGGADGTVDGTADGVADGTADGTTDGDTTVNPGERTVCANTLPAPSSGLCEVTAGDPGFTLLEGVVLAGDDIFENGGVLIENTTGRITCVGCDCVTTDIGATATRISCQDGVISPGLINGHDHMGFAESPPIPHGEERFDHRTDWRQGARDHTRLQRDFGSDYGYEALLYAELRMLFGGATSIVGQNNNRNAAGLLRNLDDGDHTEGLQGVDVNYSTFPLDDLSDAKLITECNYGSGIDDKSELNAPIYYPHIAEGIDIEANTEFRCLSTDENGGVDLIESNTTFVHGIGLTPIDIATTFANNAKLIWSPRTNVDLYGMTAPVTTYKTLGVTIGLGTDWAVSGSMNMLRELACADFLNQNHYNGFFTDRDLWKMATINTAIAMGADDQIGLLRRGYFADVAIFDGSVLTDYRAILEANVEDVALVLRAGEPLYGDANIIEGLVPSGDLSRCEEINVCSVFKRICVERDTDLTLSAIQNGVESGAYPLYFCDVPTDEPSCQPFRPNEYTGIGSASDVDGDGILDDDDNCPTIFNPERPLENFQQGDVDSDGIGDDCDPCPLNEGTTCEALDPDDVDGDGIPNLSDVCPNQANPEQLDRDEDGIGDLCDACPDDSNADGVACPGTIYEIKLGTIPPGRTVRLTNAIVTAVLPDEGYFIQVDPRDAAQYDGVDYSGLYVYQRGADAALFPTPGDIIDIQATVTVFNGQLELIDPTSFTVVSEGAPEDVPAPVVVTVAEVTSGDPNAVPPVPEGDRAEALEGVLITVEDVVVSELITEFNEYALEGGLIVNDYFYLTDPFPTVGEAFDSITGVMRFAFGANRLEPRDAGDIISGPPALDALTPNVVYIAEDNSVTVPGPLTVSLNRPAVSEVTIDITYADDTDVLTGPATVTIPIGETDAELPLTASAASETEVTVTATLGEDTLSASVRVYSDTEARSVASITAASPTVLLTDPANFTVTLNLPAPTTDTVVDITSLPNTALEGLPTTLTITSGDISGDIAINTTAAGVETVEASVDGGAAQTTEIEVVESNLTVVVTEVYFDHPGDDGDNEWVNLYNTTNSEIVLDGYTIAWGGTSFTSDSRQVTLTGTIPAKGCFLIGGPGSNADNGNPGPFDQSYTFGGIQNSGADADGVALFTPGAITSDTLPVHAVLYGDSNGNNLPDEENAVGDVDIADVTGDGESIRRDSATGTWSTNTSPTPNDCPPY